MTADLYEVVCDRWGHAGELFRGDLLTPADVDYYDVGHLLWQGIVRQLDPVEAERLIARGVTSTTTPVNQVTGAATHGARPTALRATLRAQARQIAAELGAI